MDQLGIRNQPIEAITAGEAAARLGVKLATLYAYASRGLVRRVAGENGRQRKYLASDIDRLKARHDARSGHGPVAAGALRWGDPVLETSICRIDPALGPMYRGTSAVALAQARTPFEAVAELLWTGTLPATPTPFEALAPGLPAARLGAMLPKAARPLDRLVIATPLLALHEPLRFSASRGVELGRARRLIRRLVAMLALGRDDRALTKSLAAPSLAEAFLRAVGGPLSKEAIVAIDRALVLCADHELNPSSFAARIAASVGADLYACVGAAQAVITGPLHGGACDRTEALVAEVGTPKRAAAVVAARTQRGEASVGFGHPLYPHGDPRAVPLLAAAKEISPRENPVRTLFALVEAMEEAGFGAPSIDVGLVALALALGLPEGSAAALFAIGRSAGWIANVLEQREAKFLVRPRARYVGA